LRWRWGWWRLDRNNCKRHAGRWRRCRRRWWWWRNFNRNHSSTGKHFSPINSGSANSQTASATKSISSRSASSAKASFSQKQRSEFDASNNWQHLVVSPDLASGSASKGAHASLNAFVLETQDFGISNGPIGFGETRPDVHGTPTPTSITVSANVGLRKLPLNF
jgi:hypothetical protein